MKKTTAQLRSGDLLRVAREDGFYLFAYRGKQRHSEFPVFQVRLQPMDDLGKPVDAAEILYLAASATVLWLWVGMLVETSPPKILEQKRLLARTNI